MKNLDLFNESHEATYCPEDNKLRLYVGRVPRDEYNALRAEGWQATPKQDCDFAAVWTVDRKNTAESYAGIIGDEDQSPEERAADRAERFAGYREKRLGEATGHADRYDDGPSAYGYQHKGKAVRAAARHDRHADRALDSWSKAEYWQRRTAGVISNALYNSRPDVRFGRIKKIESEKRKAEKAEAEYLKTFRRWQEVASETDPEQAHECALYLAGNSYSYTKYQHPREPEAPELTLYSLLISHLNPITGHEAAALWLEGRTDPESEEYADTDSTAQFIRHCELRLAYENQMIEAQGERAATVEMEPGGFIGGHQIHQVNKSPVTGRVVSVKIRARGKNQWDRSGEGWHFQNLTVERLSADTYRAPTEEEKAAFLESKEVSKARAKAKAKSAPKLINPTDEDAEKLQAIWNEQNKGWGKDSEVMRMTQAQYSAASKGSYARFEAVFVEEGGTKESSTLGQSSHLGNVCKVRCNYNSVIVLTDKPQKPLPAEVWSDPKGEAREWCKANLQACHEAIQAKRTDELKDENQEAWRMLRRAKWASSQCWRSATVADELQELLREHYRKPVVEESKAATVQPDLFS